MKKLILIMLGAIAPFIVNAGSGADTVVVQEDPWSVTVGAGFESEYSFRGETLADNVYTAQINATIENFYLGVDGFYQAESTESFESEVDVYAGYTMKNLVVDWVDFDVGVKAYTFPHSDKDLAQTDVTYELYAGLILDEFLLNPAGYIFYDFTREAITLEGSIHEDFSSDNVVPFLGPLTFTPSAYVGYTDIQDVTPRGANTEEAYVYAGAALDVSFEVGGFTVSAGPRYVVTDTDNPTFDANELSWGASASYKF
jgi:hypothetical protein